MPQPAVLTPDDAPTPGTYRSLTSNPGKRRRAKAKANKAKFFTSPAPHQHLPAPPQLPHPISPRHSKRTGGILATFDRRTHLRTATSQVNCCFPHSNHAAAEQASPFFQQVLDQVAHAQAANAVLDPVSGASLSYTKLKAGPDGPLWICSMSNELGRLAQGVLPHMPTGTDTIFFIKQSQLPPGRTATYMRIVAELKPNKAEIRRIRCTVGGNRIDYPGNVSTPTSDLTTAKILFNSVISTKNAKFTAFDISNFYLNNPMDRYEYMRIPMSQIPQNIITQYNLQELEQNGFVLVEIRKGMYGLPQAGIIANVRLVAHLKQFGYYPCQHTPGLFQHDTRPVTFCLVVDDFGIKYVGEEHAHHLLDCLRQIYTVTTDWTGSKYCGLDLKWDYENATVDVSMPGYVERALHRFQHAAPTKPQHAPHTWSAPVYGTAPQLSTLEDNSPNLDSLGTTKLQEIVGVLLYYARAVDNTMLVALSAIASAPKTEDTAKAVTHLLNYAATHPDATIRYHASAMTLHVHSDASYLSEPKARSRSGGYFFLSDNTMPTENPNAPPPPVNGSIHTPSTIMKVVVASATEAEFGALFFNAKDAAWLRTTLIEMGHPQPATPIQTDNLCAAGIVNDTVKQRRSKAIDMRFYWIKDRVAQGQFIVHWRKGSDNLADYFTKHHSAAHHRLMRSRYLLSLHRPAPMHLPSPVPAISSQGCVGTT